MRLAIFLKALSSFAATGATVIYESRTTNVAATLADPENLWLTLPDLTAASGFVLKPQGACLDEFCVPIPKSRKDAFLRQQDRTQLFNVAELARTLHQAALHDATNSVWLFGARPESQMKLVETLQAPDF